MRLIDFHWRSLKTRVTLFTLIIFLTGLWSLAFYISRMQRDDMQRLLGEQQFSTVSLIAATVNQELDDRLRALKTVAAAIDPALLGNPVALQRTLEQQPVFYGLFNGGVNVLRLDGVTISTVPPDPARLGASYMDRDYVVAALKEGKTSIGRPVMGKVLQAPIVSMVAPIHDAQGKVIGALMGVTNLGKPNFLDMIEKTTYGKTGGYLLVAPQHRLIITATDKKRIMEELPAPGVDPVIDGRVGGKEGTDVFVNQRGVQVLSSAKRVPVADWFVVVSLPTEEAFAPIYAIQRHLLLGTLLFTLLAVSLISWLTARMMKRQLAPMLTATRALATLPDTDQTPQPLPVTSQDEIGELIAGFNRLLQTLAQREETLHESESRYRTLVEWTPEPIGVHRGGKLLYVNPAAIEMFGEKSAQNLIGKPILELVHPDFHQTVLARIREQIQDGVNQPMIEEKFLKLDGTPIDVAVQSTPIIYDGEPAIQVAMRDITARKQIEVALRDSEARYREMFESNPQPMWVYDFESLAFLAVNDAAVAHYGYSREEFLAMTIRDIRPPEDLPRLLGYVGHLGPGLGEAGLWHHCRKDGSVILVEIHSHSLLFDGRAARAVLAHDETEHRAALEQIQNLAFSDPLTGLANRRLLLDRLKQALASGARHQRQGALLFIDLDDFRTVNDALGHDHGDLLLQQVAKRLLTCVREGDTVARLGGDEFVVLLEDLRENTQEAATQAETVAEKILVTLNTSYQLGSHARHSTASVGITLFGTAEQEHVEEPMKRAELAMYQAQTTGRGTLCFFEAQMQAAVATRAALEAGLREAIAKNQFLLHYQAQVTDQGRITGVEALVRWQDPRRGLVPPAEFIQLAEETGLILPLGQWVLETACKQLALWATQPEMENLTMAVNVSARQFHHKDFVDQVLAVLGLTGANPQRLKLELTESLLVSNIEDVIAKMSALKDRGVGFSLDDFGTGYSSLSYLKRLPLDQLKIDISFVRDILTDPSAAAIAKTVIDLAENLGLAVIAEGVEVKGQRDLLARQGCRSYQGYLFSRPLPLAEFEVFAKGVR